ncbi:MAG: hypothetical protein GX753_05505 [Erysipelothrix sp.]|nr:hypothetical protein [Erysipelothrix sp.]
MKKIKDKISAYSYAILLALSISVYLLFSFVSIVDGMFVITDFSNYTAMQWILFAASIVLPTFFGVLINISFRQFGYKVFLEDEDVQAMKNRILDLMGNNENEKRYRTVEQYMKANNIKDIFIKILIGFSVSAIGANILLTMNWNTIMATLINLLMWVVFGFMNMIKVIEYGQEEGKLALKQRIRELENGNTKTI